MQHVREKDALDVGILERGDIAGIQKIRRGIRQVNKTEESTASLPS